MNIEKLVEKMTEQLEKNRFRITGGGYVDQDSYQIGYYDGYGFGFDEGFETAINFIRKEMEQ